jgi:hypothetical protein
MTWLVESLRRNKCGFRRPFKLRRRRRATRGSQSLGGRDLCAAGDLSRGLRDRLRETKWAPRAIAGRVDWHRLHCTRRLIETDGWRLVIPDFDSPRREPHRDRDRDLLVHRRAQVLTIDLWDRASAAQINRDLSIASCDQPAQYAPLVVNSPVRAGYQPLVDRCHTRQVLL